MKKREYTLATEKLIDRMCRYVEREDYVLNKKKSEQLILKTYDLFKLPRPKNIVWCEDPFSNEFKNIARSAGSAWSAGSAGSARSAWSAWSAGSARSAWSAGSAWSAWSAWSAESAWSARSARSARSAESAWSADYYSIGWTGLDDDFYYYVFEYEYCKNPTKGKPNKNDKIYLKYSELLLKALEAGLGYRIEIKNTLYLSPCPIIKIDDQNRFHSVTGPAIKWKNGHEFYYVHGVNVDEKIIKHPEKLSKDDWLKENNLEVRRIIQDQMPDFVKKIGGKQIQKDSFGTLLEVILPSDPEKVARYVKVKDASTPKVYYLRVPPLVKTCKEGVGWTFGFDEKDFNLSQET